MTEIYVPSSWTDKTTATFFADFIKKVHGIEIAFIDGEFWTRDKDGAVKKSSEDRLGNLAFRFREQASLLDFPEGYNHDFAAEALEKRATRPSFFKALSFISSAEFKIANTLEVPFKNGLLTFHKNGEVAFRKYRQREFYRTISATYDKNIKPSERFKTLIEEVTMGSQKNHRGIVNVRKRFRSEEDKESEMMMREFLGATFVGDAPRHQKIAVFTGFGANGKSTLLDIVSGVLGDLAIKFDASIFKTGSLKGSTLSQSRTASARLVFSDEGDSTKIDEKLFKTLTPGSKFIARELYSGEEEIVLNASVVMSTNAILEISDARAIRRRILAFPFENVFEGANKNPSIVPELLSEKDEVAAALIQFASEYIHMGRKIRQTKASTEGSDGIFADDPKAEFLESHDIEGKGVRDVYEAFRLTYKETRINSKEFKAAVLERGYSTRRTSGGYVYSR